MQFCRRHKRNIFLKIGFGFYLRFFTKYNFRWGKNNGNFKINADSNFKVGYVRKKDGSWKW